MKQTLFDAVGGLPTLQKVHKIFYDMVYAHPWLKQFFAGHNQELIENRQTTFMGEKMGGPVEYLGKPLRMAHRNMYISRELFDVRQALLRESLQKAGVADELAARWLRIDNAFMQTIVKNSIESFYKNSFAYEKRLIIPRPDDAA